MIKNYDQEIEKMYHPENFEPLDDELNEDHDCHLSPDDSCEACEIIWTKKHNLKSSKN